MGILSDVEKRYGSATHHTSGEWAMTMNRDREGMEFKFPRLKEGDGFMHNIPTCKQGVPTNGGDRMSHNMKSHKK